MMKKMTIQELIETLEKIDNKEMIVNFHSISNNARKKKLSASPLKKQEIPRLLF